MPTYNLQPHPGHTPLAVQGVAIEVVDGDYLHLCYRVSGTERLLMPTPSQAERTDELWRTTCFELFLMFGDQGRYAEFNFSPSSRWATYAFSGYREGRQDLSRAREVAPIVRRLADGVAVTCDLAGLPNSAMRMALSAVIEEEGGVKSYWALAHPPGAPDFHHPACFAATLPAVGTA